MQSPASQSAELSPPPGLEAVEIALVAIGLIVLAVVLRRCANREQRAWLLAMPARPNRLWPEFIAIPIAAFVIANLALGLLVEVSGREVAPDRPTGLLVGSLAQLVGGLVCMTIVGLTFERGLAGFLWGQGRPARQALVGLLGLLAAYPLCAFTAKLAERIIVVLVPAYKPVQHEVLQLLARPDLPEWVVPLLWVSAVLIAPFTEEAFYRGVCQTALNHVFKRRWASILIIGVVFGLSHYTLPHFVAPLVILGLALGYVYEKTGSIVAPFVLHSLFNLKTMILFTLSGA